MRWGQNGGLWYSFCVMQMNKFQAIPISVEMLKSKMDGALSNLC